MAFGLAKTLSPQRQRMLKLAIGLFTGTPDYHQHGAIDYHQPTVHKTNFDMLKCVLGSEAWGNKCINQNVLFIDELKIISLVLFAQASKPSIDPKKV